MQLASDDMEARLLPVKWESGTRTPSTRSQKSTSSTSANESMPAWDNGLLSSNSTPSATKLIRAHSHGQEYEAARCGVKHGSSFGFIFVQTGKAKRNHGASSLMFSISQELALAGGSLFSKLVVLARFNHTNKMLTSAGETPEMRPAWPIVCGRILASFCRASKRRLGTLEKSKVAGMFLSSKLFKRATSVSWRST